MAVNWLRGFARGSRLVLYISLRGFAGATSVLGHCLIPLRWDGLPNNYPQRRIWGHPNPGRPSREMMPCYKQDMLVLVAGSASQRSSPLDSLDEF